MELPKHDPPDGGEKRGKQGSSYVILRLIIPPKMYESVTNRNLVPSLIIILS